MIDLKAHWQGIYQEKSAHEVSWYQKTPQCSLAFIHQSEIGLHEALIDVGGGASRLVEYLLKEGYTQLAVLDISKQALDAVRIRLGDRAGEVEWFEADITEFEPSRQYALWHDRAVFHFLTTEAERTRYLRVLKQALRSGGYLIIAAFSIGGPNKCSGLEIVQYDAARLMAELGAAFQLLEQRDEIHITPTGKEQKFSYYFCRRL